MYEKLNFAMEYDKYYATQNEGSRNGFYEFSIHSISVAMESRVFSADYSGKYYLDKGACTVVKEALRAGIKLR